MLMESNAEVIDALSVEFNSLKVSLPVKGRSYQEMLSIHSEKSALDRRGGKTDFTMIDAKTRPFLTFRNMVD